MAKVAVFGTVAADVVLRVPARLQTGDHISAEPLGWRLGGSSANVACGLAAVGHDVLLIGPIGTDRMAGLLVAELERRGVRTEFLRPVDAPSPRALILLDPDGERTILVVDRVSASIPSPTDGPDDLGGMDCVYVESYDRFSTTIADRSHGALLVATPAPRDAGSWPADIMVGSEQEYALPWPASPFEAALSAGGPRLRWVVVTRGAAGADAYGSQGSLRVDSRVAAQVDATGAGDAFASGLIAGLLARHDMRTAMELGAAWGAEAVETLQSVPPDWLASIELGRA